MFGPALKGLFFSLLPVCVWKSSLIFVLVVWTAQCGWQSLATSQLTAPSRSQLFCVPGGSRAVEVTWCWAGAEPAAWCLWCAWDKTTLNPGCGLGVKSKCCPAWERAPFRNSWMDSPVVLHWYVLCTLVWAWSFLLPGQTWSSSPELGSWQTKEAL